MRVLIVTAVEAEAKSIGDHKDTIVIVGGIGRTNAAAATTQAILEQGPFDAVLSAGVAGSLPGAGAGAGMDLDLGDVIVATKCVYVEEGLITPEGFKGMQGLGFTLGSFEGNEVPVDSDLLELVIKDYRSGPIATVATCSGTDEAAREVVRRTGALAEAMEGAAVVHAAMRLGLPGLEVRAISNTTGRRDAQRWDLRRGLSALGDAIRAALASLQG
ncbi:MAG: futalosine hydrolase [Planctomycetota bacterium]|nr:futalosine hydrolase [Planctomycetota bacterium]